MGVGTVVSIVIFILTAGAARAEDLSRRLALEQALSGTGITVNWRDDAASETIVRNVQRGNAEAIARQLLQGTSYVFIYRRRGSELSHIIVSGLSVRQQPTSAGNIVATPVVRQVMGVKSRNRGIQERVVARDRVFARIQQDTRQLKRKLAALSPGTQLIRTQPIRLNIDYAPGQTGNIPLLSSALPLPLSHKSH